MADDGPTPALPDPVVPPDVYTREYFSSCCAGYEDWVASGGAAAAGVYAGCLDLAALRPGETVVDLGTGRGELLAVAVERGAARAVGVEYAADAVAMARTTLERTGVGDRAEVVLADARRVPLDDGVADLVTLLDVVEHLAPDELAAALGEARRLLRPGGRVFVHTMPNREIYDVTYRWLRRLWPGGRHWPADPRNAYEHLMHVNEQSRSSLRRALEGAGFDAVEVRLGEWLYTDFVPSPQARRLYPLLARWAPTRRFGAADLFATARR